MKFQNDLASHVRQRSLMLIKAPRARMPYIESFSIGAANMREWLTLLEQASALAAGLAAGAILIAFMIT